jgi:hypothetical protein
MAAVATPPMLTARMVTEEPASQPSPPVRSPYTGAVRAIHHEAVATAKPGSRFRAPIAGARAEIADPV